MERAESTEKKLTTPSTEAPEKPVRRRFSTEYKLRILAETDASDRDRATQKNGEGVPSKVGSVPRALIH